MLSQGPQRLVLAVALAASVSQMHSPVPEAVAAVNVIPYRAEGWSYLVCTADPPAGWQDPDFDDSGFAVGCAAFGTQGACDIAPCTAWPLATRIVLRKRFDLPADFDRAIIGVAFDNAVTVYVNGFLVGSQSDPGEICSPYNRALFNAPNATLRPTGNVIAVLGADYGQHSLLDLALDATLKGPPPPPPPPPPPTNIASCTASDQRSDGVLVSWLDVDHEEGYRVYRQDLLVGSTGPGETSFLDQPPPGTYSYCVQAFNDVGMSNPCCDPGTRKPIDAPGPCAASDASSRQVIVTWTNVAGEDGYRISRGGTLIHTAGPDETSYIDVPGPGTYSYCIRAFGPLGTSDPCCDSGTQLALAYPSPCGASDNDPSGIVFTWANIEEEDGYRVYRDGTLIHTTGPDVTSFADTPPVGTYLYGVEAFNAGGASRRCTDWGTRVTLPTPAPCSASDGDKAGVRLTWANVAGEDGYRIHRDGSLIHTADPNETSYIDVPGPGTYSYCIRAFGPPGTSDPCCDDGTQLPLTSPSPCGATDDNASGVVFTWANVEGEDGYRVYRDGALVDSTGPDVTSFTDTPAPGTYSYCVQAYDAVGTSDPCCDSGTRKPIDAPGPCAATDGSSRQVVVTWTNVAGEDGYHISRNGSLIYTAGPEEASYLDAPGPGTYRYCIWAFGPLGTSDACCDDGRQLALASPSPCGASDNDPSGIVFTWANVEEEDGYRVYRDGTLIHTTGPDVSSFADTPPVGTYLYGVEAFHAQGESNRCTDWGTRVTLPTPAPCSASDADTAGVRVTWANVAGEDGYRIHRGGSLIHTAGRDETSFWDTPVPGSYDYCMEAFGPVGSSAPCCDSGRRLALLAPPACNATDADTSGVLVTWGEVPNAEGYRVYRNDALVHAAPPGETSFFDSPGAGTYLYCIEAFNVWGVSPRCCDSGTHLAGVGSFACSASDSLYVGVLVEWSDIGGGAGYRVYRNGTLIHTAAAGQTAYSDIPAPGTYLYCVEPFVGAVSLPQCCDTGTRGATSPPTPSSGRVRFSWGSCDPQYASRNFAGSGVYKVVVSATQIEAVLQGYDTRILIGPGLADAWRFDAAGCQGSSMWSASTAGFSKTCPPLVGASPLAITNFSYDAGTQMGEVRMAVAFNEVAATPLTRYTLWQVNFDHTYSVVGPGEPGNTCGGAERPYDLDGYSEILLVSGQTVAMAAAPGDARLWWNGGAVRAQPTTWGRVKDSYR